MAGFEVERLWAAASKLLEERLPTGIYSRWIAVIRPGELAGDVLTLCVANDFYQAWLEEHYLPMMEEAVRCVHGSDLRIAFRVDGARAATPPETMAPDKPERIERKPTRPAPSGFSLNPAHTFQDFIVGPSNTFAHAAALAVAQAPGRAYNPLFIYGGSGLGKTHMIQAIGHHVLRTSNATVAYLSIEAFVNEYITALQNRTPHQFRKKYRSVDLLLIDDIHFLAGKPGMQEEFFHTFNTLFDARKQIVMTSDRPAREIAQLEHRLVSRFDWGLVTDLQAPDYETRMAFLQHKQSQAKLKLPDEFLQYIAANIRSDFRHLDGAFVRTVSYAALTGKPLTLDTVKSLLKDMIEQDRREELTFDRIQRAVAEYFDVRLADMSSARRPKAVAQPRQIAMFLCRRLTHASLPDIAASFGKTHATVLHACKTIEGRMGLDRDIRGGVEQICRNLGRNLDPVVENAVGNL